MFKTVLLLIICYSIVIYHLLFVILYVNIWQVYSQSGIILLCHSREGGNPD